MKKWDLFTLIGIICIFLLGVISSRSGEKEKQCNHLKANKDLIWMDNILHSKDTIVQYFEDGSRLEFYPTTLKNNK